MQLIRASPDQCLLIAHQRWQADSARSGLAETGLFLRRLLQRPQAEANRLLTFPSPLTQRPLQLIQ